MKNSYLTVTDQFCGAGGSTLGAIAAGVEVRLGLNHWPVAVETYNHNHPQTDVECTNISVCDPRRYRSTDILITSPECTTHSPAGGNRRRRSHVQLDAFIDAGPDDPAFVRSRATAWDVVRFTEVHRYRLIIVENVYEFTRWELYQPWLAAMDRLGYAHRAVSLNSMFCHPTPQSRDRVYIVFWQKGNRAPNLEIRPRAWCPRCERGIEAVQTWKNGRTVGKYRQQYVYSCQTCRTVVTPYYYAALNAIDFSIPAERIGDRRRRLAARTLARIRYGIEKYGRRALLLRVSNSGGNGRYVADGLSPWPTQTTAQDVALLSPSAPFLVPFFGERSGQQPRTHALDAPTPAVTSHGAGGVVVPPGFLVDTAYSQDLWPRVRSLDRACPSQTAQQSQALLMPFVVTLRQHARGTGLDDTLATVSASGTHHLLLQGAALLTLRDHPRMLLRGLDEPLATQIANGPQDALISPAPFLLTYDLHNLPTGLDEPVATVTTIDRHALIGPDDEDLPAVEDCYFRMLEDFEIGRAMAFPPTYKVVGTKRDRVKQYGNAVTPPAMDLLVRRAVESLHPELAA